MKHSRVAGGANEAYRHKSRSKQEAVTGKNTDLLYTQVNRLYPYLLFDKLTSTFVHAVNYCFLPVEKHDNILAIPIVVVRKDGESTRLIPLKKDGSRHLSCPRKCASLQNSTSGPEWPSVQTL